MKSIEYSAPSNIALVKYWGKYGNQMPSNPSISFTLSECSTRFKVTPTKIKEKGAKIKVIFEGKEKPEFVPKIESLFSKIEKEYPIVNEHHWKMETSNTFPHSSGIASSASSMAALAMCIENLSNDNVDIQKASNIARLGSGSASRSVIPKIAWWGENPYLPLSKNEYAIPVWEDIDAIFHSFQNTILIASSAEKSVSSTLGHQLMNNHSYANERFKIANQNCLEIYAAMRSGDMEKFGEIVESEALSLHSLMMMSSPSFILMKPSTISMIEKIRAYRKETKNPIYFTLDAGPNIHLLYPESIAKNVSKFIDSELKPLCENGLYINDKVGDGPEKIS